MVVFKSLFAKYRVLNSSKVTTDKIQQFCIRKLSRHTMSNMKSDYEEVVERLNNLQSNSNVLEQCHILASLGINDRKRKDTQTYLQRIGISPEEINSGLSVIHVTGTKGKGSACAYCESILRQYGYKTGFYSSPHLVAVRERIRINGQPLSESDFAYYFSEVYNKLEANRGEYGGSMPFYFMFLTVMAMRVFLAENVDVAIIEVGIGGEHDCTNIFRNTPVVGISSLGLDHTELLGDTVEEIAWQKAGIMKKGSIVLTSRDQPVSALKVLQDRAKEKQAELLEVPSLEDYEKRLDFDDLNLHGTINPSNASLGLQLAYAWLAKCQDRGSLKNIGKGFQLDEQSFLGIKNCKWPGRQHILTRNNSQFKYFVDGAHTVESMNECVKWFKQQTKGNIAIRVLLFNVKGNRDVYRLFKPLLSCHFDIVIFSTNTSDYGLTNSSDLIYQYPTQEHQKQRSKENERIWLEMNQQDSRLKKRLTETFETVKDSIDFIENLPDCTNILVTGSLHLVGAFFSVVGPELILNDNNSSSNNNYYNNRDSNNININ